MSPILSIIIPAYNAAVYLQPCLDSIFSQEYTDFETIVIDDGSTDNTATLLEQYPQVKVVHQENQGMSTARNRGMNSPERTSSDSTLKNCTKLPVNTPTTPLSANPKAARAGLISAAIVWTPPTSTSSASGNAPTAVSS